MDTKIPPASTSQPAGADGQGLVELLQARIVRLERRLAMRERQIDKLLMQTRTLAATTANPDITCPLPISPAVSQPSESYAKMIGSIREMVERHIPAGGTVMVISRGDDELLKLGGRKGWHFPQTETGIYAGHHPADSAAAIQHLETLRSRGGQFLVIPATAFWWLDHYTDFHRHLAQVYTAVAHADKICQIYDVRIGNTPPASPAAGLNAARYASLVSQVRQMVDSLVPADAEVAVISRGDPELLKLGKRQTRHAPADANGGYAGHHPENGREAVDQIKAARKAGAQFLVVPQTAFWWLDFYPELARHLATHARLVQNQPHVGAIFELCKKSNE